MKLKKLLALALAGVMAVSMLAGCKGGNKPEDPTEEPTGDTSIATALNEKQADDENEVQIAFVYDASLETAVKAVLDVNGNDKDQADAIKAYLEKILDVENTNINAFNGALKKLSGNQSGTQTKVYVARVSNKNAEGVANDTYDKIKGSLDDLKLEGANSTGSLEYAFSYDGKAATVTVEGSSYGTDTYVVLIISCTTTTTLA